MSGENITKDVIKNKSPPSGEEKPSVLLILTGDQADYFNSKLDGDHNPVFVAGEQLVTKQAMATMRALEQAQAKIDTSLNDVHTTFEKWLYVDDTDRIDLALAVGINYKTKGTPLWIVFVSPSGDWKSELLMSFTDLDNMVLMDQITKNTLATGLKDTIDLGSQLTGKRSLLIFPDLASLMSCNRDDKKMIWAQFRELYDGRITKMTGSGIAKKYDKCYVNLLAGATGVIENEYLLRQQIGTREMLYDCDPEPSQNKKKMEKAWENESYEEDMRADLWKVVTDFCRYHKTMDIEITPKIKEFLFEQAEHLSLLRATGDIDWTTAELKGSVDREVPTRLSKQFKRLWIALKSLDPEYPDKKAKRIIRKLVDGSGSKTRQKIIDVFNLSENADNWLSISDLQLKTSLGRKIVKAECEQLTYLHSLEKRIYIMHIGGERIPDRDGEIAWSRGFDREVDQYKAVRHEKPKS